jgi:carboxypeptidase C (cathepsin A)
MTSSYPSNILFRFLQCAFLISLTISGSSQEKKDSNKVIAPPQSFVSTHTGVFGGKTIVYKATAKEIHLKNDKGEPVASIWSVAYTQEGNKDITRRPVSFVFNGGPGSASLWLHMGMLGPQIVQNGF